MRLRFDASTFSLRCVPARRRLCRCPSCVHCVTLLPSCVHPRAWWGATSPRHRDEVPVPRGRAAASGQRSVPGRCFTPWHFPIEHVARSFARLRSWGMDTRVRYGCFHLRSESQWIPSAQDPGARRPRVKAGWREARRTCQGIRFCRLSRTPASADHHTVTSGPVHTPLEQV